VAALKGKFLRVLINLIYILNLTYFPYKHLSNIQNPDRGVATILEEVLKLQEGAKPNYPIAYIAFLSRIDFLDNYKIAEAIGVWIGYCVLVLISMHLKKTSEVSAVFFLIIWNSVLAINPLSSVTKLYSIQIGVLLFYLIIQIVFKLIRDTYQIFDILYLLWINLLFYVTSPVLASVTSSMVIITLIIEIRKNTIRVVTVVISYGVSSLYGLYLNFYTTISNLVEFEQFINSYSENTLLPDLMTPQINLQRTVEELMVTLVFPVLVMIAAGFVLKIAKNYDYHSKDLKFYLRLLSIAFIMNFANLFQINYFAGRVYFLEFLLTAIVLSIIVEFFFKKWPPRYLSASIILSSSMNLIFSAI
jgi:hypothetical protein